MYNATVYIMHVKVISIVNIQSKGGNKKCLFLYKNWKKGTISGQKEKHGYVPDVGMKM